MMVGIKKKNRDLPPFMARRTYTNKKGKVWVGYYYTPPRDENGRKTAIPLGSDLAEAKRKWAELEGRQFVSETSLSGVLDRFFRWAGSREESGLSERTLQDYKSYWKFLEPVFGKVDINKMKPEYLMRYFHERTSKYRAKREIKFLSLVFNWSRARGLMTAQNPAAGIIRQMKATSRRTIYVTDADFELVYQHGSQLVKDAMDIAYLTGQRPADVFKMKWSDISDDVLHIEQNKTGMAVRIAITGNLADVLNRIKSRQVIGKTIICDHRGNSINQFGLFRYHFDHARDMAELDAKEKGIAFNRFQFKDIRAKAATDSETQTAAQKLLGHKNITTTTIYRRDKKEIVNPLMDKSLLPMSRKHRT